MENKKTRKWTWQSILAFGVTLVLACTMVGIVAYASASKTLNIGGNVTFSASGIEATVTATSWEGCTINTYSSTDSQTSTLQEIKFSTDSTTDNTKTTSITWTGLSVVITDTSAGDATLTFTIKNGSTTTALPVKLDTCSIDDKAVNASVSVTINGAAATAGTTSVSVDANSSATVVVTFKANDYEYDATINTFSVAFTLGTAS